MLVPNPVNLNAINVTRISLEILITSDATNVITIFVDHVITKRPSEKLGILPYTNVECLNGEIPTGGLGIVPLLILDSIFLV